MLRGNLYLRRALTLELPPVQQETHPTDHQCLSDPDQEKAVLFCKQEDQAPLMAQTATLGYVPYQGRCRFVVSVAGQSLNVSDPTGIFPIVCCSVSNTCPLHHPWPTGGGLQAKPSLAVHKQLEHHLTRT